MRLAGKSQRAGDRDVGMADCRAEPVWRGDRGAFLLQHFQHAADLRLATRNPDLRLMIFAKYALVYETHRLVAKPRRQRAQFQHVAAPGAPRRDYRLVRPYYLIEIIQDPRALDQRLAAIQHQRRHSAQRIERRDLVAVAEGRPRPVLEGETIKPHRNRDAADEGGVVLADQDQGGCSFFLVIAGLDPAIHLLREESYEGRWMPGSSPGMTN